MKDNSEFISKVEFLDIYPLGISKDDNSNTENKVKICVIGLGYVGLPIYLRLSKYFETIGYDNNSKRVLDLNNGYDFNL